MTELVFYILNVQYNTLLNVSLYINVDKFARIL